MNTQLFPSGNGSKAHVTVNEVKQAITRRISVGLHPRGSQLPSVRTLADELGANRNTVNKAYRQLSEQGMIRLSPSRKSFVVGANAIAIGAGDTQIYQQAMDVVWQAMAAGVPRERLLDDLSGIIDSVYGSHQLKIKFIECNQHDTTELATELTNLIGEPVEPCLLDYAVANVGTFAQPSDLIVTTFHHLAEVSRAFVKHADKIIGVDTRPSHRTLLAIARMHASRITLVCTLENTAQMLRHIINSYHPKLGIDVVLIDDTAAVKRVARSSTHIVVTRTCAQEFTTLTRKQSSLVIEFCIDEQSIAFLSQCIRQARQNSVLLRHAA